MSQPDTQAVGASRTASALPRLPLLFKGAGSLQSPLQLLFSFLGCGPQELIAIVIRPGEERARRAQVGKPETGKNLLKSQLHPGASRLVQSLLGSPPRQWIKLLFPGPGAGFRLGAK